MQILARNLQQVGQVFLEEHNEIVKGDVADKQSLQSALSGCRAVHVSMGGQVDQLSAQSHHRHCSPARNPAHLVCIRINSA